MPTPQPTPDHQPTPAPQRNPPSSTRPPAADQPIASEHTTGEASRRRFIVCGDTPLAYRIADQLIDQYDGLVTVILASRRANWGPQISSLAEVTIVESDRLDEETFRKAGLPEADALGLLNQEDAGNVDAALLAQELRPDIRIVIRMFNLGLGERIGKLLNDCVVLSAAAIAAPAFVAAALDETTSAPMVVAGQSLVATSRASANPADIVCGLAMASDDDEPETLPAHQHEDRADFVLARTKTRRDTSATQPGRAWIRRRARADAKLRRRRRTRVLAVIAEARIRLVLAAFVLIFAAATAALAMIREMSWPQAALVALISELGGANADPTVSGVEGVVLAILTLASVALIPVLTATVVDSVVKLRLRAEAGQLTEPVADHIIVVGLGNVGTRVILDLEDGGHQVVAIERNPQARGVQAARDRQIPVIIGDASRAEVLQAAGVDTCRTLVIVSTDDVSNLETALLARGANPTVRVVLRLFDGDFADRVQRAFAITTSRSVSYLAAPAFAAAMLGRQIIATVPVGRRVLLVAELPVAVDSVVDGASVESLHRPHELRPLAVRAQGVVQWSPPRQRVLTGDDRVVVVASRTGLSRLLTETAQPPSVSDVDSAGTDTGVDSRNPGPEMGTERANPTHPFGPADVGSTQPA